MIYGWQRSPLHSLRRIRWLVAGECGCTDSDPKTRTPAVDQLLQRLVAETQAREPVPAAATGSAELDTLLRNLLSGNLAPVRQPRPDPYDGIGMW